MTATHTRRAADPTRRTAIALGVLFLITFATAIGGALFYAPLVDNTRSFVLGTTSDTGIRVGALLELILILTNFGTALVIYPLLRRHNEWLALGYVVARVAENAFILVGILAMLAVVSIREQATLASDPESLVAISESLVAVNRWTFVLGPGWVVGIGNGVILAWLMWRSGLLSRRLSMFGLIGGPLLTLAGTAVLLGVIDRGAPIQGIASIPEMIWEGAILGVFVIVKGFDVKRAADLERRMHATAPAPSLAAA
jgi:hypothetical protein